MLKRSGSVTVGNRRYHRDSWRVRNSLIGLSMAGLVELLVLI